MRVFQFNGQLRAHSPLVALASKDQDVFFCEENDPSLTEPQFRERETPCGKDHSSGRVCFFRSKTDTFSNRGVVVRELLQHLPRPGPRPRTTPRRTRKSSLSLRDQPRLRARGKWWFFQVVADRVKPLNHFMEEYLRANLARMQDDPRRGRRAKRGPGWERWEGREEELPEV